MTKRRFQGYETLPLELGLGSITSLTVCSKADAVLDLAHILLIDFVFVKGDTAFARLCTSLNLHRGYLSNHKTTATAMP